MDAAPKRLDIVGGEVILSGVAHAQDVDCLSLNGEENAVDASPAAVQ
jgi:hypothetical protein